MCPAPKPSLHFPSHKKFRLEEVVQISIWRMLEEGTRGGNGGKTPKRASRRGHQISSLRGAVQVQNQVVAVRGCIVMHAIVLSFFVMKIIFLCMSRLPGSPFSEANTKPLSPPICISICQSDNYVMIDLDSLASLRSVSALLLLPLVRITVSITIITNLTTGLHHGSCTTSVLRGSSRQWGAGGGNDRHLDFHLGFPPPDGTPHPGPRHRLRSK